MFTAGAADDTTQHTLNVTDLNVKKMKSNTFNITPDLRQNLINKLKHWSKYSDPHKFLYLNLPVIYIIV